MMNHQFRFCRFLVFVLWVGLLAGFPLPGRSDASPREADEELLDSVRLNHEESSRLSSKLSSSIKVYDSDWFRIITSKSYAEKVEEEAAPNVVNAVAEFCRLFSLDPRAPYWPGGLGRLVFLRDRDEFKKFVSLVSREEGAEAYGPSFVQDVEFAQSFFRLDPCPLAAACGDDADYNVVVQHIFHMLGHILLTRLEFNRLNPPPWLHEGYGEYLAMRFAGGNILYCTPGLNNCVFGTGVFSDSSAWARSENWVGRFQQSSYLDAALGLEELNKLPFDKYTHPDAAQAWEFTTFLIEAYPAEFKQYVCTLKKPGALLKPDGVWTGADYSSEMFQNAFGKGFESFNDPWRSWARNADARTGRMKASAGKSSKQATVRFDPAMHLDGFMQLTGKGSIPELVPFQEQSGQWMRASEVKKLRGEWAGVRQRVDAALAKSRAEHLSKEAVSIEEVMERVIRSKSAQFLSIDEVGGLIRPGVEENVFRSVVSLFVNAYGCKGALARLKAEIEKAGDSLAAAGLDEDVVLLEQAAEFESKLFHDLAGAGIALTFDFWPGKLELESIDGDQLVFRGKALKGKAASSLALPEDCELSERGNDTAIRCPASYLSLDTLIKTAKKSSDLKSDEEARLGFAQLMLFSGNAPECRKELKFVKKEKDQQARIERLLNGYERTRAGVDLLNLFLGKDTGTIGEKQKKLFSLLDGVKGTPLMKALHSRGKGVAGRILLEHYLSDNQFLKSFCGFRGIDGPAGVRFEYTFDSETELNDFDLEEPPLVEQLVKR
ncbi:MAG: hypothetical protein ABIK28_14490, partial [Planctomycetota bacterium]